MHTVVWAHNFRQARDWALEHGMSPMGRGWSVLVEGGRQLYNLTGIEGRFRNPGAKASVVKLSGYDHRKTYGEEYAFLQSRGLLGPNGET